MEPQIVPLVVPIGTRDGGLNRDSLMKNCFVEQSGKEVYAKRRAGLLQLSTFSGPASVCQGSFLIAGVAYAIWNDTAYNTSTGASYTIPVVTTGSWPDQLGKQYSILTSNQAAYAVFHNGGALYKFNGATFTRVVPQSTGTFPGDVMMPGIVELDGTVYVLTLSGTLYGSAINDPTTWPALNFNLPSTQLGQGMAIGRHLAYIQCFYANGVMLYYDAGQFPGLPVLPVQNGISRIGCAAGKTVVEIDDVTLFMSYSKDSGRSIYAMSGLGLEKVSTPEVELLFEDPALNLTSFCFGLQISGHKFYVLSLITNQLTLVYDLTTRQWYQWTQIINGVETYFYGTWPVQQGTYQLLFGAFNGLVYLMSDGQGTDNMQPIQMLIRTDTVDWGTRHRKFFGNLMLVSDTANEVLQVRWTDNDYQTWTAYQEIDLSSEKKQLLRTGSSIDRAWEVLYTGQTQMRLYKLLPEVVSVET